MINGSKKSYIKNIEHLAKNIKDILERWDHYDDDFQFNIHDDMDNYQLDFKEVMELSSDEEKQIILNAVTILNAPEVQLIFGNFYSEGI